MGAWDSDKLWLKAKLFVDKASEYAQTSSDFAFWSSLSLECLARSALTHIHPALNADPREDLNLLYGFGYELTAQPRSIPAHTLYLRLEKTVAEFGKPHRELCEFVALLRNAHIHTADVPYENLMPSKWLPRFYETVKVLNGFLGKSLQDFLGPDVAPSAQGLINSLSQDILSAVKGKISAHKKVFDSKSAEEQKQLSQAAEIVALAVRFGDQIRKCPACGSEGTLHGGKVKEFPAKYEHEELMVDVQYVATGFKCSACGLHLKGVEEVTHAGLDTHFTETRSTSLHELYEPEHYQEYDNM